MKTTLKLIAFLLVLVVAYAIYGLVSFQPDQPRTFVFNEPTLPPDILAQQESQQQDSNLTPDELAKKDAAVRIIQDAMDKYQSYEHTMPQQSVPTISLLNGYFISGSLPAYFLGMVDPQTHVRKYGMLTFTSGDVVTAEAGKKNISCLYQTSGTETLIGSEDDNVIECDAINKGVGDGDRLILGGPGDDKITDTYGNRIVNGGSGNDSIALGPGRSIIILEDGWGDDQLTVDCGGSVVAPAEVPGSFPIPWVYKTTNFIVLSPRLDPNDMVWDGLTLKTKTGEDKLTVNENCFTVIPAKKAAAEVAAQPVAQ